MTQGLLAQLSPNEEVTLRRIAFAVGGERLPNKHVRHLERLNLIERFSASWRLTALGRQRYESLRKPPLQTEPPLDDVIGEILGKHIKSG